VPFNSILRYIAHFLANAFISDERRKCHSCCCCRCCDATFSIVPRCKCAHSAECGVEADCGLCELNESPRDATSMLSRCFRAKNRDNKDYISSRRLPRLPRLLLDVCFLATVLLASVFERRMTNLDESKRKGISKNEDISSWHGFFSPDKIGDHWRKSNYSYQTLSIYRGLVISSP